MGCATRSTLALGLEVPGGDLLEQAVMREVDLDGRDRDKAVGHGVQVGAGLAGTAGRPAADPVVVAPKRILARDQLVAVLALAEARDLDAANGAPLERRHVDVE